MIRCSMQSSDPLAPSPKNLVSFPLPATREVSMSGEDESVLEQNKRLVCRFFDEAWNQGRREAITEVFTKTAVLHSRNRDCHGPAEFLHFYDIMHAQFSQISIKPIV